MKYILSIFLLALTLPTYAQEGIQMPNPLDSLTKKQKITLSNQANQFLSAARPAVSQAAKSTVTISYRGTRISYGTVVKSPLTSKNVILTKWSEIANMRHQLIVTTPQGKYNRATLIGIYPEYDLALLATEARLTPLNLKHAAIPALGDFIALANPSGSVQSLGVVSVKARSLRETDKAYLGVLMDFRNANPFGIPLDEVVARSPADRAGLRPGDIVISVNHQKIKGAVEMRNTLQKLMPGSQVLVHYRRGDQEHSTTVHLGSRPQELDASRIPQKRMDTMQRMGTVPSYIRHNFPSVIQSDMRVQLDKTPENQHDNFTNECGGPVADLNGKVVGIVIARGSRIKTFIVPTSTLQQILRTQPATLRSEKHPSRAQTAGNNSKRKNSPPYSKRPPRAIPVDE